MLINILAIIGACTVAKWALWALDASRKSGQYNHWLED